MNQLRGLVVVAMLMPGVALADRSTADRYEGLKTSISVADGASITLTDERTGNARESMGWISGVYGVLMMQGSADAKTRPALAICSSSPIQTITMARLFVRFVEAHPDMYGWAPETAAILSAKEAYPCH